MVVLWFVFGSDQGVTARFDQLNDYKIQSGMPDGLPAKASVISHRFYISSEANNQIALRFFQGLQRSNPLRLCSVLLLRPLFPSISLPHVLPSDQKYAL